MAEDVAGSSMPQDIVDTLYSGENPLCVLQNLRESGERQKIVIVTDQRLMYFEENATGMYDDTLFAFARIESVVSHEGKKVAELKITDTDATALKIAWLTNEEAERVLLTLQSAMNDLGTALVSLDRRKSMFSGEEWTLKKPVDYLTRTVKADAVPMAQSYIAPILPRDGCGEEEEAGQEFFETESGRKSPEMRQEDVLECLRALRTLSDHHILTEEQYRKYRLPLLEKLDI